jgi:6-phosphogluconate dehydrogenase
MKESKLNCGMIGPVTMECKLIYNMSDHGYTVIGFDKNKVETLKKVAGIL